VAEDFRVTQAAARPGNPFALAPCQPELHPHTGPLATVGRKAGGFFKKLWGKLTPW